MDLSAFGSLGLVSCQAGAMISVGDRVVARKAAFQGRVLGGHGIGVFEYRSLPENPNVAVYAVLDSGTGEVRFFTRDAIEPEEG